MQSLSHVLSTDMPLWPRDPPFQLCDVASFPVDGYLLRQFSMGDHSGTHVNAPNCFIQEGIDVEQLVQERNVLSRIWDCIIIDVSAACRLNPAHLITWDEIAHILEPAFCVLRSRSAGCVFFYTGWSEWFWSRGSEAYVQNEFPGVSHSLAERLLREGIVCMGIDTHGIDGSANSSMSVNVLAAQAHVLVIECMALCQCHCVACEPSRTCRVVLAPMPIRGGTGCPIQVLRLDGSCHSGRS